MFIIFSVSYCLIYAVHGHGLHFERGAVERAGSLLLPLHGQPNSGKSLAMLFLASSPGVNKWNGFRTEPFARRLARRGSHTPAMILREQKQVDLSNLGPAATALHALRVKHFEKHKKNKQVIQGTLLGALDEATSKSDGRIIVELKPSTPPSRLDMEYMTEVLRKEGASALIVPEAWLDYALKAERLTRLGGFRSASGKTQPMAILCGIEGYQNMAELKDRGVAGVAVSVEAADDKEMAALMAEAKKNGLSSLVIAKNKEAVAAATSLGATVVACRDSVENAETLPSKVIGAWGGDLLDLDSLRVKGFNSLLLLDCGADMLEASAWLQQKVQKFKESTSKSREFVNFRVSQKGPTIKPKPPKEKKAMGPTTEKVRKTSEGMFFDKANTNIIR